MRLLICSLAIICNILPLTLSAQTRIAILGDLNRNRPEIDILTEKLSKESGIVLVERSEIEKVLREQEIAAFGTSTAVDSIKTGHLLGAQGVIIVKAFDFDGESVLSARLVAVEPGAIVNVWVNDTKMHNDSLTWGTAAAQVFIPSLGKLAVSKTDAIPVSILNIRASWNNESGLRFANKLRLLMELRLMMQKEVFILERWRLGALQWEKNLQETAEQFWTGAYIVEGRLENFSEEKDTVEISVFLSRPGQEKPEIIRQIGKLSEPVALANSISNELLVKMGKHPTEGTLESWKVEMESSAYANEAFWAYRVGQYETSRAAADAALTLGNDSPDLRFVNVKSHLAEFAEKNSFSVGRVEQFRVIANADIRGDLLTKEKISILINGVQACKEFAMGSPDNATKFWGPNNDWRVLCAETISCAASVLKRIENDKTLYQESVVLRRLCRDFSRCVVEKGSDSDLIYPFLATYINRLPCFADDSDMMLDEYKWFLSLDFPALPNMRLKIRESLLYIYNEKGISYTFESRKMDDWFKQAEKNGIVKDLGERIQRAKGRRDTWCDQMISSPELSDNMSGFITRKSPSDIPKIMDLYEKNSVRIATGGDSYDCVACVPTLISAIMGYGNQTSSTSDENSSVNAFSNVFQVEDPTTVDLSFLLKQLNYYYYTRKISTENCRKISRLWWDFKKRLMQKNPASYLIHLNDVNNIDERIELVRKKMLEDSSTPFLWEKKQAELGLKDKIDLPVRPEYFNNNNSRNMYVDFRLKKMTCENGKLNIWGFLERNPQKLPIMYSIDTNTWEIDEYRPPADLSGLHIGEGGIFISSKKNLYYVDENGIILKTCWGRDWDLVVDAKLKNPTTGCHAGGSLFVAFGVDTKNLVGSSDTGWRSDIIEIPDGSAEIKKFASNTRRPRVVIFDDCRPYETMTIFGSPDESTLFFAPYIRPCYKLFYCDLKDPLEWKISLHQHVGSESKTYENPYDGGVYFSCVCGHIGWDLNFSKGLEAVKIFGIFRETIEMDDKAKESCKWSANNLGNLMFNNNATNVRGAFNGKNLVFYRGNDSSGNYLLCFKDGSPGPFKIVLQKDERKSGENPVYYRDISLASSEDFLFIFASRSDQKFHSSFVWVLRWKEILEKIKGIAAVPDVKITPSIFTDSARVTMSTAEGEKVRYTINSDLYEDSSKIYSEPFELKESCRIIACSVKSDNGVSSLPEIRDCLKMPLLEPVELKNPASGLRYTCWKGSWEKFPIFENIPPSKTGIGGKIDMDSLGMGKYFAAKFSAFIKIPADGLYRFNIDAQGAVMMKFHGAEVHGRPTVWSRTEVSFSVGLKAGYHPVEIYCTQNCWDVNLKIEWQSAGIARQTLPEDVFFIDE